MNRLINRPVLIVCAVVLVVAGLIAMRSQRSAAVPAVAASLTPTSAESGRVDSTLSAEPIGRFFYLFDVSASTHNTGATDPLADAVAVLPAAVDAIAHLDEVLPQDHAVGTIGSTSLRQHPLCRVPVNARTIFVQSDTAWYRNKVTDCAARIHLLPAESHTDIRGALDYAAQSLAGSRKALRVIFLFSDLEESLAPQQTAAVPNLGGMCIVVFAVMTPQLASHPDLLVTRQQQWSEDLNRWGARKTRFWSTIGFDGSELQQFLRSCEVT